MWVYYAKFRLSEKLARQLDMELSWQDRKYDLELFINEDVATRFKTGDLVRVSKRFLEKSCYDISSEKVFRVLVTLGIWLFEVTEIVHSEDSTRFKMEMHSEDCVQF